MERIIETGLGSFQIRSRWRWVPEERIIEVYEIPYTTKTDVIIDRIVKLSKEGKVREIADIRDETDLSGLRIAIDLKRGVDPDKLMAKLYRTTTLQDSFSCNFNVLVDGYPRVMGVRQILHEWVAWRIQSTRRRVSFDLGKKSERLHLLHGLEAILLDIDKAIAIIRGTKLEAEVVPNLMRGFDIDDRTTTLQDSFSCNFNVLVDGYPRVMGVRQILHEWVAWRIQSTRRRVNFDLGKKSERLHLLHGLEAILLDIDKAIAIIRGTKLEAEVVPNLMRGFCIDETQAEFVAELKLRNINEEYILNRTKDLKLRNINEEYILNRTKDIAKLEAEIAELEEILSSEDNIKKVIRDELAAVNKKYVMPRRTGRIEPSDVIEVSLEPEVEEYPVTIMLSREGYLKKMTVNKKYVMPRRTGRIEPSDVIEVSLEPEVEEYPVTIMLSREGYLKKMTDRVLRKAAELKYKDGDEPFIELSLEPEVEEYPVTIMLSREGYLKKMTDRVLRKAAELKYKDGDEPFIEFPSANTHELLVFTNKSQVYKCKVAAFEDTKSAQLGSYLATDLEMDPDESVIWVIARSRRSRTPSPRSWVRTWPRTSRWTPTRA